MSIYSQYVRKPMDHEELLAKIDEAVELQKGLAMNDYSNSYNEMKALRAVVELHKPSFYEGKKDAAWCYQCVDGRGYAKYPCPTIQAIEKELK